MSFAQVDKEKLTEKAHELIGELGTDLHAALKQEPDALHVADAPDHEPDTSRRGAEKPKEIEVTAVRPRPAPQAGE
jgi:hypothetical protein